MKSKSVKEGRESKTGKVKDEISGTSGKGGEKNWGME
jgi:hypothetical protein